MSNPASTEIEAPVRGSRSAPSDSATKTTAPLSPPGPVRALELGHLDNVLGYHLAVASATMRQVFARHIGDRFALTPVEFSVLQLLLANADVSPAQLCRALLISPPNMTTLLGRLTARHLIKRERNHRDGRSQVISLTDLGRQVATDTGGAAQTMERDALSHLSFAQRAMAFELVRQIRLPG